MNEILNDDQHFIHDFRIYILVLGLFFGFRFILGVLVYILGLGLYFRFRFIFQV